MRPYEVEDWREGSSEEYLGSLFCHCGTALNCWNILISEILMWLGSCWGGVSGLLKALVCRGVVLSDALVYLLATDLVRLPTCLSSRVMCLSSPYREKVRISPSSANDERATGAPYLSAAKSFL